jgi:hypothetical protein
MDLTLQTLDREEVKRYLGMSGKTVPAETEHQIDSCIQETLRVIRPRAVYLRKAFQATEDGFQIQGSPLYLSGKSIQPFLEGAAEAWFLAVTVGQGMDRLIRTVMVSRPEESIILDCCGAVAVEAAADLLQAALLQTVTQEGLQLTPRFSPGYGDLPIELQRDFLNLLDAQRKIGLTITESSMLVPSKSITALIGIRSDQKAITYHPCDACIRRHNCELRKAGKPCWHMTT